MPMADHIALIHRDTGSGSGVSFTDFPGCITAGATLDQAQAMAQDALTFHVEGLLEDGRTIPEPSSLAAIMADANTTEGMPLLITLKGGDA